jgi:Fe-S-cluster containining protein
MNELRAMQDEIGEAKPLTVDNTTLTCSFLRNGQCSAYAARPLLCRVFGVSRKMPCEFGCEPNHWLTEDEEQRLWRKWKEVAGPPLVSELTP